MEKLIPYSIHLKPEIHAKIKEAAGERKAAALIRNAITTYLENEGAYESGYSAGYNAAMTEILNHPVAQSISWRGTPMSEILAKFLDAEGVRHGT